VPTTSAEWYILEFYLHGIDFSMALENREFAVGIVGAGIAGCCASYFVREAFGDNVRIVVYEEEARIGGRIHTATFAGAKIELGAGLIHSSNRLLVSLMDRLSLSEGTPQGREIGKPLTVGLWNGQVFALRVSGLGLVAQGKLAFRYGLSLMRLRRAAKQAVARWSKIYGFQRRNHVFLTPRELFEKLGIFELAQEETYEFLRKNGVSERVATELFDGISRAVFNQNGTINAFAGAVALAAGGIAGGRVLSVLGGNDRLCQELLNAAGAHLETNRRIVQLRSPASRGGSEKISVVDQTQGSEELDAVILAAPFETSRIRFEGVDAPCTSLQGKESKTTYVTYIVGRLSPVFFGLSEGGKLPALILTTETQDVPFSSISFVRSLDKRRNAVYKMQSREAVDDRLLFTLFVEMREVLRVRWMAYTALKPTRNWPSFKLRKGLYYVNAMESVVSCLETEAVASKNVVGLLTRDFTTVR